MRGLILASALCLGACATGHYASHVGPIDPQLAPQVANDMAVFVRGRIKPADGPVQIDQPTGDQSVGPLLVASLRESGFTITAGRAKHRVRYAAANLGDDVMLRVSVDAADGARLYHDKPGSGLLPLGPFSVTEVAQ